MKTKKETEGFTQDGDLISGFTAKCKCGSNNVSLEYEFNYYGGMTGYDHNLSITCRDCNNVTEICLP